MFKRAVGLILLAACLAATTLAGGRQNVAIKDMKFSPASVKAKAGDSVVWTNTDDRDHTVVAADGSFKSGNIGPGQSFEHRFAKPGSFAYSCSIHPRMRGSVTVSE